MANTDFKNSVYTAVKQIPHGTTKSYQQVAEIAGYPKAARAVANLMAQNFDPTIPCHRVIRSNGTLGGYNRGGEEAKRAILISENCQL